MKRSPLKRKTPLRSRSKLAQKSWLRRRRKPAVSAKEKEAREAFGKATSAARCCVCGRTRYQAWRDGTKLDAHHVIPRERLKKVCSARRLPVTEVLWDRRNRAWVCQQPCHANHTSAHRRIPRSRLPASAIEFAKEYGLLYVIDRQYP